MQRQFFSFFAPVFAFALLAAFCLSLFACSDGRLRAAVDTSDPDAALGAVAQFEAPASPIDAPAFALALTKGTLLEPLTAPSPLPPMPALPDPDFRVDAAAKAALLETIGQQPDWTPPAMAPDAIAAVDAYLSQMQNLSADERAALKAETF